MRMMDAGLGQQHLIPRLQIGDGLGTGHKSLQISLKPRHQNSKGRQRHIGRQNLIHTVIDLGIRNHQIGHPFQVHQQCRQLYLRNR
ncbi:hypothetical protein D3C75_1076660 [compost metagenome]